jgi:hypothetical protein
MTFFAVVTQPPSPEFLREGKGKGEKDRGTRDKGQTKGQGERRERRGTRNKEQGTRRKDKGARSNVLFASYKGDPNYFNNSIFVL